MRTLQKTDTVLILLAIACLGTACDRGAERTPTASPLGGPQAELIASDEVPEWLARALSLGELLSDDVRMTAWTDEHEENDYHPLNVVPFDFDPFKTYLVRSRWLRGTGCPTDATTHDGSTPSSFTDPACATGDPKDKRNEGLLLVKTGPTGNFAAAGADVKGVKGITLTELGYDIRKGPNAVSPTGSHCGAGAPRFNVSTTVDFYFVGCNSPPAVSTGGPSNSWLRLRWGPSPCVPAFSATTNLLGCVAGVVKSIVIIFDEGQDTGPDFFGLAVLDNIDVNGKLAGHGPGN